jgi:hypothetical protein
MMNVTLNIRQPKPNLRIRIPAPRPDEEILMSPIQTPAAPQPLLFLRNIPWIKSQWTGTKS